MTVLFRSSSASTFTAPIARKAQFLRCEAHLLACSSAPRTSDLKCRRRCTHQIHRQSLQRNKCRQASIRDDAKMPDDRVLPFESRAMVQVIALSLPHAGLRVYMPYPVAITLQSKDKSDCTRQMPEHFGTSRRQIQKPRQFIRKFREASG